MLHSPRLAEGFPLAHQTHRVAMMVLSTQKHAKSGHHLCRFSRGSGVAASSLLTCSTCAHQAGLIIAKDHKVAVEELPLYSKENPVLCWTAFCSDRKKHSPAGKNYFKLSSDSPECFMRRSVRLPSWGGRIFLNILLALFGRTATRGPNSNEGRYQEEGRTW